VEFERLDQFGQGTRAAVGLVHLGRERDKALLFSRLAMPEKDAPVLRDVEEDRHGTCISATAVPDRAFRPQRLADPPIRPHLLRAMSKTYRECPACGKRALSIATRCPGCGHELFSQPVRRQAPPATGRVRALPAAVMVLLAAAGLVMLVMRPRAGRDSEPMSTAAVRDEPPTALDTARAAASPVLPDSAPSAGAVPRLARTWTKVHDRRSAKADVVAVLLPSDTVLADSLRGGWWRVALEGRVLGYVYARTLQGD
jgi:hypothetical protein